MAEQSELERMQRELYGHLTDTQNWGADQGQQGLSDEAKMRRYQQALAVARPFMSAEGRESLNALRSKTIELPTWPVDNCEAERIPYYGAMREGQNSLVRWIEQCIEIVEAGPPQTEE